MWTRRRRTQPPTLVAAAARRASRRVVTPTPTHHPHHPPAARKFYGGTLGCEEGRSAKTWIDWNLQGHQIVTHWASNEVRADWRWLVEERPGRGAGRGSVTVVFVANQGVWRA